jgi:hypothetical protein
LSIGTCDKSGCTVAESGICLLSHKPPTKCPNFKPSPLLPPNEDEQLEAEVPTEAEASSEQETPAGRTFHTGLELGIEDALQISRAHYCHLIAILGPSDAGKTCFLLSLYLMAGRAALPNDYMFGGSLTLKGFEDRARRLRKWTGGPLPAELADRTSLTDPRRPALLHLAIRKRGETSPMRNLLLTDLPGEWSTTLVDRASSADRFKFLKRADGVVLVVDGKVLNSADKYVELGRSKHLLERLTENVGVDPSVPMTILVSKGDAIGMQTPPVANDLLDHAQSLGFQPEIAVAAAFSYDPATESGTGVFHAIDRLIPATATPLERAAEPLVLDTRRFSAFGRSYL